MSGPSTIGFGTLPYRTADGKEREWFAIGLAPRKARSPSPSSWPWSTTDGQPC
jgi:hypothetical protein